jgi:hypothetical protein
MRPLLFLAAILAGPASAQSRAAFTVAESGRSFENLQDAVNSLEGGDGTIEIAPGRYKDCAVQEEGRVTFVARTPGTVVFDGGICEDKATLVLRGRGSHVEGIAFTRTFVEDGNGAGIRMEKGDLTVVFAQFLDAQSGILSAEDPASTISIDRSTFAGLGKHPDGNGAHSLYVNGYGGLRVTNCRFERGTGGHYLKSRAPRIEILNTSFDDSHGSNTNYMIDLPYGAVGRIAGNVFVNGRNKDNYGTMIAVTAEGRKHSSEGLAIENNRAWLVAGYPFGNTFVGSWTDEPLTVRNNQLGRGIDSFEKR